MTANIDELGYHKLNLTNINKKQTKCCVHRLLALQWISNPDNKPQIDHIDRNPSNNSLTNLRWVTHKENMNNWLGQWRSVLDNNNNDPEFELLDYTKLDSFDFIWGRFETI